MEIAKKYISFYESLPAIVKFILALFFNIPSAIYRLCLSIKAKSFLGVVLAIILLCTGGLAILWVIDLITIIFKNKVYWIN